MISFKFEVCETFFFFFFCDKDKLINLRDKRVWKNIWGPVFSIYLQLCH